MLIAVDCSDRDSKVRKRTLLVISVFQEKKSHDELVVRSVRDSFMDQFFPGAGSIQALLRRKSRVVMV